MYSSPHTTYNNNGSGQSSDFDFGYSTANNQPTPTFDYTFESSYPADWGMQFQGNNSNSFGGGLSASQQQKSSAFRGNKGHQRNVSDSSVNSAGPSSPYAQSFSSPVIFNNEHSPKSSLDFDETSNIFQKRTHGLQDQDQENQFQQYSTLGYNPSALSHTPAVHLDMKYMAMDQHNAMADDMPEFSHSSRQSVSSGGQDSPSTPKTDHIKAEGDAEDDSESHNERPGLYKIPTNGERQPQKQPDILDVYLFLDQISDYRQGAPRVELFRTESAAAADELYNPAYSQPATSPSHLQAKPPVSTDANYLSPNRTLVQDRIRTANSIRSQSPQPSSSTQRAKSPFRPGSTMAPTDGDNCDGFKSPSAFFASAADARRQQIEEASAREVNRHYKKPTLQREPTKTMSPRDALLDYNDTDDMPLFPDTLPSGYSKHIGASSEFFTSNFINDASQGFGNVATQGANMGAFRPQDGNNAIADFNFLPPQPQQQQPQQQQPQQQLHQQQQQSIASQMPANPYTAPQYRSAASFLTPDQTPDFPAHLTSMESSVSDAPMSSQGSAISDPTIQRPIDTSAATGGYTCTFHNCTQRFDSPAKLQKHKREIHHTNHSRELSANSLSSVPPTTSSRSANNSTSPDPSHDGSEGSVGSVGSGMTSAALAARNSQTGPHKCTRINPSTGKPCNTIFSRPYDLTRHEDTIHNRQKVKVRCQYCREEKTFSRNDALTRHMRVVHPDVQWDVKRGGRGSSVRSDNF